MVLVSLTFPRPFLTTDQEIGRRGTLIISLQFEKSLVLCSMRNQGTTSRLFILHHPMVPLLRGPKVRRFGGGWVLAHIGSV